MKRETRDRVLQAYDEAFTLVGCKDFTHGIRYICSEMEKYLRELRHARTRTGVEVLLVKEPEPTPEKLEAQIETIRLLPYQLRKVLPRATKEVTQKLPRFHGGRPRLLTPQDCKDACVEIGKLLAEGVSLANAELRIAQQMGVGVRTIQRAWQKRGQLTFVQSE
jgi:hypothetical protein